MKMKEEESETISYKQDRCELVRRQVKAAYIYDLV